MHLCSTTGEIVYSKQLQNYHDAGARVKKRSTSESHSVISNIILNQFDTIESGFFVAKIAAFLGINFVNFAAFCVDF